MIYILLIIVFLLCYVVFNLGKKIDKLERVSKEKKVEKIIEKEKVEVIKIDKEVYKRIEELEKDILEIKDGLKTLYYLIEKKNNDKKIKVEPEKKEAETIIKNQLEKKEEREENKYNVKILFKEAETFEKDYKRVIEGLEKIKVIIREENNENDDILLKILDQYKDGLEKTKAKINLNKIDEDEYSEEITGKFLKIIERDFIKLIYSVNKGMKTERKNFYEILKESLENYLFEIGVYKKNLGIEIEGNLNENCFEYMSAQKVSTDNIGLDKKIKEIELEPYFIKFINDDGEEEEYYTRGKLIVYDFVK